MQRIAVVAGPDAGHALPALGLAIELRRRGYEVRFVSGPDYLAVAAENRIAGDLLPLLAPTPHDDDLGHRLWRRAGEMAPPLAHQLASWLPDLFVVDTLTRAGAFAAELLGRPWIELVPHYLDDPDPALPPIGLGRSLSRLPWRRADDRRILRLQARSIRLGETQAAGVASTLGLASVGRPMLRLLATLPGLERDRTTWPSDAHVVGPLAVDLDLPDLPIPDGDDPLVVVTDSTATGVETRIGATALEALRDAPVRLVVTSSELAASRSPRAVVGRGPHEPLLAHAGLAISAGGAGFLTKAAAHGVPQLVIPIQGDQREEAARLRDTGAGRALPPRRLSPARLRRVALALLADDGARAAAQRLADQAAGLGVSIAADLVDAVLAGEQPRARSPHEHLSDPHDHTGRPSTAGPPSTAEPPGAADPPGGADREG